MSIVDKFLYKLAIVSFLLFSVVGLHKLKIINYHDLQDSLGNNINFLKMVDSINGEASLIYINLDDVESVNSNLVKTKSIDDGVRVLLESYEAVEAVELGIVIKIDENKVYILDKNDNMFIYNKLTSIDVNLYQIVRKNEIIGMATKDKNNNNYYDLYVKKDNKNIEWFS